MKTFGRTILMAGALTAVSFAQQWEFGGSAGGGFLNTVNANNSLGSATAGFQSGGAFGAFLGYSSGSHVGGELRYGFLQSDLKLTSGGQTATFAGQSHVVHYDLILHTHDSDKHVQVFAALGGGLKIFRATGVEHAVQPLSQFGYFTREQQLKPMASVGGGVKFALSHKVFLRAEVRDYITAFPKEVLTPPAGTKYGTLLHDIVPMVSLGFDVSSH